MLPTSQVLGFRVRATVPGLEQIIYNVEWNHAQLQAYHPGAVITDILLSHCSVLRKLADK